MISSSVTDATSAGQYQPQNDSNVVLTKEQKEKISKIYAKYDAKEITEAEKDKQIAEVKAEAKKNNVSKESKTEESKTASTNSDAKVKNDLSQQLSGLLKSKENGETNPNDVDDFVNNLKNTLGADQGVLVDQSV